MGPNTEGELGDGTSAFRLSLEPIVPPGNPDLRISKWHIEEFWVGLPAAYAIKVTNVGHTATSGTTTVIDILPPGLFNPSGFRNNWTCSTRTRSSACTNPQPIQPGETIEYNYAHCGRRSFSFSRRDKHSDCFQRI